MNSLREVLGSFFEDFFAWDSKILRTLVPLLRAPGFLTNEYLAGRRASYVRPLRLYLVCSILFFLSLAAFRSDAFVQDASVTQNSGGGLVVLMTSPNDSTATDAAPATPDTTATTEPDSTSFEGLESVPLVGSRLAARAREISAMDGEVLADRFTGAILRNLPRGLFLLLPVFALALKVVYLRSRRGYVEHLTFALHLHAFAFLILAVSQPLPWAVARAVVVLVVFLYALLALRRVYQQGWFKTLVKFGFLLAGYGLLLALAMVGTAAVSLLTL